MSRSIPFAVAKTSMIQKTALCAAFCVLAALGCTAALAQSNPEPLLGMEVRAALAKAQPHEMPRLAQALAQHLQSLKRESEEIAAAASPAESARRTGAVIEKLAARASETKALRDAFQTELDAQMLEFTQRGDLERALEVRAFKAKLNARFAALEQLSVLSSRSNSANTAALTALKNQLQRWILDQESEPSLPSGPGWSQQPDLPNVPSAPAGAPPAYVADVQHLFKQRFAQGWRMMPSVLRPTPSEAGACNYTAQDLDATPDAPKNNAEIMALAASLDHNPRRIYEWVYNNIAFEPYYGSLKGALGALKTRSGGATDQASLLAALLRASNVPVRYVLGSIRVADPTEGETNRAARWIGAKNVQGARRVLLHNPASSVTSLGLLRMKHVWIQACLPYTTYRGTGIDNAGHRWIPLDPSFKDNDLSVGVSVDSTFNFNYDTYLSARINTLGRYLLPHEAFADEVEAHVRTKAPLFGNTTLTDVPLKTKLRPLRFDVLPLSLPYEVSNYESWSGVAGGSAETAELPDRHRYRTTVTVRNASGTSDPYAGNILWQKTFRLPEIALQRLTLSFKGATPGDQSAYASWFGEVAPKSTPSCAVTVNVVPSVKLEGVEQEPSAGAGATTLCSGNNVLEMRVMLEESSAQTPVGLSQFSSVAGANLMALHHYARHTSDLFLKERSAKLLGAVAANSDPNGDLDATQGEFLNIAASQYAQHYARSIKQIGNWFGESGESGIHTGITQSQVKVVKVFDLPYAVFRKGYGIDWPGGRFGSRALDGQTTTDRRAVKLAGFSGSSYESYIWQELADMDAVSTVRGLQFAKESGIEILTLSASTWATQSCKLANTCANAALNTNPPALNYTSATVSALLAEINAGAVITAPRQRIAYTDSAGQVGWTGTVYFSENNITGGYGFIISGANGGYTLGERVGDLFSPRTGSGVAPEVTAPSFAQQAGQNSTTAANGFSLGLTTFSGDPVNMVTGNLIHTERDVSIKGRGGLPIVFERWYNSQNPQDGPLGFGWTHSFNHKLKFYAVEGSSAKVGWIDGTGAERFFSTVSHTSGNIATGGLASPPGVYVVFERLGNGQYQATERSGMRYVFENVNGTATGGQVARLISINDRNGNTLTLDYACGNQLCAVRDALGRSLTFTYTNGRISAMSDWTGRTWSFEYTNGDLVTFRNPLAGPGGQEPVRYQYYSDADGSKLAHAMREYKLPRGNGMRFEYYANGRVFRHTPFGTDGVAKDDHATSFSWTEFRREAIQTDALGNKRTFFFDKFGNPVQIIDEAGASTDYTYDPESSRTHLRTSKTDHYGQTTQYAYDTAGNLSQVTYPSGRTEQYLDYTGFGQPRRVRDAAGNWRLLRYDAVGNLTDEIALRAGVTPTADVTPAANNIVAWTKFGFDASGNPNQVKRLRDWSGAQLASLTSGVGPTVEAAFDANRLNPVSITRRGDRDGTPVSLEVETFTGLQHDNLGRRTLGPDGAWYSATTAYDALDRVTQSTDPRGRVWNHSFDPNGNPNASQLVEGAARIDAWYSTWDGLDRRERLIDVAGNATLWAYNALGHEVATTDADGYRLSYDRDPMGRPINAYNQMGYRALFDRDATGRVRAVTDPNGLTTTFSFYEANQDGRPKATIVPAVAGQAAGKSVEIAVYDAMGRPQRTDIVGADGTRRDSYAFYDELGRKTRELGPVFNPSQSSERLATCYVYTPLGDVSQIWAGSTSDTTSSSCSLDGVNIKLQLSMTYDDWGNKLSQTDALNRTWRWSWNAYGEMTSSQTPVQVAAGLRTNYTWDRGGLLKTRVVQGTAPADETTTYTYNKLGQPLSAVTRGTNGSTVAAYEYTYDSANRLVIVSRSGSPMTLSYRWTPGGRLAQMSDSQGHQFSYNYDAAGRLSAISAPNGEQFAYVFDPGGRLVERTASAGLSLRQQWYEDGNLKLREHRVGTSVLASHAYSLDAQGRRAGLVESVGGVTKTWSYGYDGADRLVSANDGQPSSFGYDVFGNRRSVNSASGTVAYLYDAAHQLSTIRSGGDTGALIGAAIHDAAGRMTRLCEGASITINPGTCSGASVLAMDYAANDQLVSAVRTGAGATSQSYAYDHAGRRVKKTVGVGLSATTTHYVYQGDAIHSEHVGSLATPGAVLVHGPGTDDPLMQLTGTSQGMTATPNALARYFLSDGLGSVVGLVGEFSANAANSQASQRFEAWGATAQASGTIPLYGYTGREPDGTGLMHYRARSYHPALGRFTSRDPAGMVDAVTPYAYVGNGPTMFVDPMGRERRDPILLAADTSAAGYWGRLRETATDFGRGFISMDPLSPNASAAETIGRGARVAVDWGLVGFDVANTLISPTPDVGVVGAAGITGRSLARESAEAASTRAVTPSPQSLAGQVGREGEAAVRAGYDIGERGRFVLDGRLRIPDGVNPGLGTLSEIKNVERLSLTRQLRDYSDFAQQNSLRFDLYTRPDTRLSGPLQDAVTSGRINLRTIPR